MPAIHQRVLILHPREDDYADLSNAHYLQRKLPGSVEMVVLEDSYHIITIDRQRDVVVEKSAAFVEGVKREIAKPKRKVAKLPAATATAATGKAAARRPAAQALPAAA